jgi:predicted transcriptional regulator
METRPKITEEMVALALLDCEGHIGLTAKKLGVTTKTVRLFVAESSLCQAAKLKTRPALYERIMNGRLEALEFALKSARGDSDAKQLPEEK